MDSTPGTAGDMSLSRTNTVKLRALVRSAMRAAGIQNNAALGEYLGVSHRSVYNFMRAERTHPTLPLLAALAERFNLSFITLLCLAAPQSESAIRNLSLPAGIAAADQYRALRQTHIDIEKYVSSHEDLPDEINDLCKHACWQIDRLSEMLDQTRVSDPPYEMLHAYWQMLTPEKRAALQHLLDIPVIDTKHP